MKTANDSVQGRNTELSRKGIRCLWPYLYGGFRPLGDNKYKSLEISYLFLLESGDHSGSLINCTNHISAPVCVLSHSVWTPAVSHLEEPKPPNYVDNLQSNFLNQMSCDSNITGFGPSYF